MQNDTEDTIFSKLIPRLSIILASHLHRNPGWIPHRHRLLILPLFHVYSRSILGTADILLIVRFLPPSKSRALSLPRPGITARRRVCVATGHWFLTHNLPSHITSLYLFTAGRTRSVAVKLDARRRGEEQYYIERCGSTYRHETVTRKNDTAIDMRYRHEMWGGPKWRAQSESISRYRYEKWRDHAGSEWHY